MTADLRALILEALNTAPAAFVCGNAETAALRQQSPAWRHEKHRFHGGCALCRGEADTLADAVLAAIGDDAQDRLLADMMERSKIRSMDFRRGVDMDIEAAEEICAAFVAAARTMLGDAPNYSETPVEFEVKAAESPESYVYVLTVQRAEKPTPHQMRERAEAERDAALARVADLEAQLAKRAITAGDK